MKITKNVILTKQKLLSASTLRNTRDNSVLKTLTSISLQIYQTRISDYVQCDQTVSPDVNSAMLYRLIFEQL